jgi:hypothetical protein
VFILPDDTTAAEVIRVADFGDVTTETLTVGASWIRTGEATTVPSIAVIYGSFGRTDLLLADMGIPYTSYLKSAVAANPSVLDSYGLIVDDCPGWQGYPPADVLAKLQDLANAGARLIFTDIGFLDMDVAFPGKATVVPNWDGNWSFEFHQNGDSFTQYGGNTPVTMFTDGGGSIATAVADGVSIAVDCAAYGRVNPWYAIAAFYFTQGAGLVEGVAFHAGDQISLGFAAEYAASVLSGNLFFAELETRKRPIWQPSALGHMQIHKERLGV